MHAELRAEGVRVGRERVARIMRTEGLAARRKRRYSRTTDSKHSDPIAPNLLERDFHADAPNRVWVTDVTCVWTAQGWLFLAAMLDLFSRRVVGWATSPTNDELALAALQHAIKGRSRILDWSITPTEAALTRAATTDVSSCVTASLPA